MPIEKLQPSFNITKEKIEELKQIFPEAFADNQINWESLKQALSENLEDDNSGAEHFGLNWPGKREAKRMVTKAPEGTVKLLVNNGVNEKNTKNIFVEGENLRVLKILQKSYNNKIRMIYIDPPYNTGTDQIYQDDFSETLESYLAKVNSVDEKGNLLRTNSNSDGRFHSNWLTMIYPRIKLSYSLLDKYGVLFCSIDEKELSNILKVCDEIFGEENRISIISRVTKKGGNAGDFFAPSIDYIIVYAKDKEVAKHFREEMTSEKLEGSYDEKDSKSPFYWRNFYESALELERSRNARYFIEAPDGSRIIPPEGKRWRRVETSFLKEKEDGDIKIIPDDKSPHLNEIGAQAKWKVMYKSRPSPLVPNNYFVFIENSPNSLGTTMLNKLGIPFEFSKPVELIEKLINLCLFNDDTDDPIYILDYFAGSCTTAQAVMQTNPKFNKPINFLLIQLKEEVNAKSEAYKKGYRYITEIGKDRMAAAIKYIKEEQISKGDLGFKYFILSSSNLKKWLPYEGDDTIQLEAQFEDFINPTKDEWNEIDLIYEIMLIEGFTLDSDVLKIDSQKSNELFKIVSNNCDHSLWICLDKTIDKNTIDTLSLDANDIFICFDTAIKDEDKAVLSDKGLIKTI